MSKYEKKFKIYSINYIIICVSIIRGKERRTTEEILDIKFDDIAYVKTGSMQNHDDNFNLNEFIYEYKDKKYRKFVANGGGTAHKYFACYDEYDNIIFTIVEIGNRNLVFLKKGLFNINTE